MLVQLYLVAQCVNYNTTLFFTKKYINDTVRICCTILSLKPNLVSKLKFLNVFIPSTMDAVSI